MAPRRFFPIVLAGFTSFLDLYATQPLLPLLMDAFGASHFAVSLTITVPTLAVAFSAPIVGRIADLVGRKRVIVGSAFGLAVSTALAATAGTLPQLLFWRFLQGLATPGVFAITIAYIHEEYPGSHGARATSAYVSGTVTGGFVGRALVAMVASAAGWKPAFLALSAVNLVTASAIAAWMPKEAAAVSPRQRGRHSSSVLRLLRNPQLNATNAVGFCVLFVLVAVFTNVTFYLSEPPFSMSTAALGWLFTVYLVGAVVTPIAGHWVDAYGHRVGIAAGAAIGVAGSLLTLTSSLPLIIAGLAMISTGVFVGQATASSYIGAVTSEDRGLAVGIYSTCYYVGGSLGGGLPALFWNRGGWTASVAMVIAVQIASAAIALRLWKPVSTHSEPLPEGIS